MPLFMPTQAGFKDHALIFSASEESSQPNKNVNKIIISIF